MKTIIILIASILTMTVFTQCGSAQFDKNAPFTISNVYHQDWVGGRPGSKGTLVTIETASTISKDVVFDSIFFKNRVVKLDLNSSKEKSTLTGNFIAPNMANRDIIMHADPKQEFGNKPPTKIKTHPFELSDNECVISYIVKDKKHYYKIENIKKGKNIYYP